MMSMADHRLPQSHLSKSPSVHEVQLPAAAATSLSHPLFYPPAAGGVVMADHQHQHQHQHHHHQHAHDILMNSNIQGGYDHSNPPPAASNHSNNVVVVSAARSNTSNNNSSSSNSESPLLLLSANNKDNWGGGLSPSTHLLGIHHRLTSNTSDHKNSSRARTMSAGSSSESSRRHLHNSSHGGDDKDGDDDDDDDDVDEEELPTGRGSSSWLQLGIGRRSTSSYEQQQAAQDDESTTTPHHDPQMRLVGMGATATGTCSSSSAPAPAPSGTTGLLLSHHDHLDLHLGPCSANSAAAPGASSSNQHHPTTILPPYYNYYNNHQINHHHMIMGMGPISSPSPFLSSSIHHHGRNFNLLMPSLPNYSSSSSTNFTVIDPPPRRPHSGIWFMLQPSLHQGREPILPQLSRSFLRIKDGRMTVRLVMKYVATKLGLDSESQVEIKCRGQQLVPFLTLQHVRDRIWSQRDVNDYSATLLNIPNSSTSTSTSPHVMLLHYGRIASWSDPTTSSSTYT